MNALNLLTSSVTFSDLFRYLISGQAAFVLVLSAATFVYYAFQLKKAARKDRALPWHIVLISCSYLLLTSGAAIELRIHFGEPLTWRIPIYFSAFLLGDIALVFMLVHLSVRRIIVKAVLEAAKIDAAAELTKQASKQIEKIEHIEEVVEQVAKHTQKIVGTSGDTNVRVKKMDGNH